MLSPPVLTTVKSIARWLQNKGVKVRLCENQKCCVKNFCTPVKNHAQNGVCELFDREGHLGTGPREAERDRDGDREREREKGRGHQLTWYMPYASILETPVRARPGGRLWLHRLRGTRTVAPPRGWCNAAGEQQLGDALSRTRAARFASPQH